MPTTTKKFRVPTLPECNLGKWPMFLSSGKSLTLEQTYEIILRTTNFNYLDNNPNEYIQSNVLLSRLGLPEIECHGRIDDWVVLKDFYDAIGSIESSLEYLLNHQFYSSYVGGRHGWIDWNGNIHSNDMSVGKYPDLRNLWIECKAIATAFPFLDCTFQFIPERNGYEDESGTLIKEPIAQYRLLNGKVTFKLVDKTIINPKTESERMADTINHMANLYAIATPIEVVPWEWDLLDKVVADLKGRTK
jgi:hypothetical protein